MPKPPESPAVFPDANSLRNAVSTVSGDMPIPLSVNEIVCLSVSMTMSILPANCGFTSDSDRTASCAFCNNSLTTTFGRLLSYNCAPCISIMRSMSIVPCMSTVSDASPRSSAFPASGTWNRA